MSALNYRKEIDGLRAVAVAAVVLYHVDARLLPGGCVGVDVFFVISGYLITSLLRAEWLDTGRIDLPAFYARRIRRLMPALWVVVAAVLLATAFWLAPMLQPVYRITDSAVASLAFFANVYFQIHAGGYFEGPADQLPLLHLWSLAVEEQFYLVYPVLLWVLMARAAQRVGAVLVLLSLASLALAEHWLQIDPAAAFYQMPSRFWELDIGGLVALSAAPRLGAGLTPWTAAAGLGLIVAACVLPFSPGHFPGLGALPAVLGATLVIWAVHERAPLGPAGAALGARPVVALGLVSYSLYLWHWPLLALDRATRLDESPLAWRLGLAGLAVVLAWLSYRWVETPLRRSKSWTPRQVFVAAGLALSTLMLAAVGLGRMNLMPDDVAALVEQTRNDRPANMARCHFGLSAQVTALPGRECQSRAAGEPRIAIWGDSHALAWQPFAWRLAAARNVAAIGLTMDSCPPAPGHVVQHPHVPGQGRQCAALNALALQRLSSGGFDVVVLSSRWTAQFPGPADDGRGAATAASDAPVLRGLELALAGLSQVPEVLVIGPTPELRGYADKCIASGRLPQCAVSREQFDRDSAHARGLLSALVARFPNATLVDPGDYFCGPDVCPVMKQGRALYWDDDHVAASAADGFAAAYLANPARYTALRGRTPPP